MTSEDISTITAEPLGDSNDQPRPDDYMVPQTPFLLSLYPTTGSHPEYLPPDPRAWRREIMVQIKDCYNVPPKVPPPYSEMERSALERWRMQVSELVEKRIATYNDHGPSELPAANEVHLRLSESPFCSAQNAFDIPEIHDMILDFAGPEVQVRALWVSKYWRASALRFITSRANQTASAFMVPGTPVEYIQISPDYDGDLHYSDEQVRLASEIRNVRKTAGYISFPRHYERIQDLIAQWRGSPDTTPRSNGIIHALRPYIHYTNVCLDLSRLQINPYLDMLFSEEHRITHRLGRWEISLRAMASLDTLLLAESAPQRLLIKAIGLMQITNPPCQCLGLYYAKNRARGVLTPNVLLKRLRRDDGIRVIDLLVALKSTAPALLSRWTKNAERLRDIVKRAHWLDDIWKVPGAPTVRIHLDNRLMADKPSISRFDGPASAFVAAEEVMGCQEDLFRSAYMFAEPSRATREGVWIPEELFEPMKSQTGRHPINWTKT